MASGSSQESLCLPLSQETFVSVWNGIPDRFKESLFSDRPNNFLNNDFMNSSQDNVESANFLPLPTIPVPDSIMTTIPVNQSSLPSTEDFPGFFKFIASLPHQDDINKKSKYVYSTTLKRLYVKKDAFCPFHFTTGEPLNEGFSVRAMVYFSSPENLNEIVVRCVNHSYIDRDKGDLFHEHILTSYSRNATYFQDSLSKRYSVVVPYEKPPLGQSFSSYLYKLSCWTSCSGGPNRRLMCIVFTLEHGNLIMGRSKIDVKVCSCPYRDKMADEKKYEGSITENLNNQMCSARGAVASGSSLSDITNEHKPVSRSPKRKHEEISERGKEYIIKVSDEECYKLLKGVKKWFYMLKHFKPTNNWVPSVTDVANLLNVLSSSGEGDDV